MRALLLLMALPVPAGAVAFHVPVHVPPHRYTAPDDGKVALWLGGGAAAASAPGLAVAGPGGFWELAAPAGERTAFHVHSAAHLLQGRMDPATGGRRDTHGMTGSVEADLSWAPRGRDSWHLYAGAMAGLSALDVADPVVIQLSQGRTRAEPGFAYSMLVGLPVGVLAPWRLGRAWSLETAADVTVFPGGSTLFTYGPAAPPVYGSSRRIHAHAGAGARLRLEYEPWRLAVEAAARGSSASGNNEPTGFASALLSLRLL